MNLLGFDFPEHLHYLVERDMWCELLPDGRARVGITGFGVRISGHFFMCRPKPVGTSVEQGATLAVAELNKSVVTIKTPLTGVVDQINPLLVDTPEVIEHDPYGRGWLVVLTPNRLPTDLAQLCTGERLASVMESRMRLENLDFSEGGSK